MPQSAQWGQVREWMLRTLERASVDARMGLRLHRCFMEAGLPAPTMTLEAAVAGGDAAPAWGWANLVRGAVPLMERLGVATAGDVAADTLADRLLSDVRRGEAAEELPLLAHPSSTPSLGRRPGLAGGTTTGSRRRNGLRGAE